MTPLAGCGSAPRAWRPVAGAPYAMIALRVQENIRSLSSSSFLVCGHLPSPDMIRRLLSRLLPLNAEPRRYAVAEHGIKRESLSPAALNVALRLHEAGFAAYIVGGA